MDGYVEVDGAVIAAIPAAVGKDGVEDGVVVEAKHGGTGKAADGEDNAVAAYHAGVVLGLARGLDVERELAVGYAVGGGVGIVEVVETGEGVSVASPGFGTAGRVAFDDGGVDNDGEVEVVDAVAVCDAVDDLVSVGTGGGIDAVVPSVVAAVFYANVSVDRGDYAEVEAVDMGAAAVDGCVVVDAGGSIGAVVPGVAATGGDGGEVGFDRGDGENNVEDAVAETGAGGSGDSVGIVAGGGVGVAAPGIGATGADDDLVRGIGSVDGQVEDKEGVVSGIDVVYHGVGGVCLLVDSPCEGFTCRKVVGDNGALGFDLGKGQRHAGNGQ